MPRIQTTPTVKFALILLRLYLLVMLALIVLGFWRHRNDLRQIVYPTSSQVAASAPSTQSARTLER